VNALPPLKVVQLLGNACLSPTTLALKDPNLLSILGGKTAMTESPLIREIVGDRFHKVILKLLGACPRIRVRNPQVLVTKQLASFEPN